MPNYRRYYLDRPVFLTLVTAERTPWLAARAPLAIEVVRRVKALYPFRHLAHVILPDHMHWLIEPVHGVNFSQVVASFKRGMTAELKGDGTRPPFWQKRFYDHLIRDEVDFQRHLDYIHYNPVKHGHAAEPGAWPHSSFRHWLERGYYAEDWGRMEPGGIGGMELE